MTLWKIEYKTPCQEKPDEDFSFRIKAKDWNHEIVSHPDCLLCLSPDDCIEKVISKVESMFSNEIKFEPQNQIKKA